MPIVSIFGATGTQGSAVLQSILKDGTFTPRAITRNPESEHAKSLKAQSIHVVKGDLSDKESLREAMRGTDMVFGMTNVLDPAIYNPNTPDGSGEIEQGKNLVDAAKEVGVKFFVWSTLPNATAVSGGKYPTVYYFDNKNIIFEYLKASGVPCTAISTAWFAENLWNFGYLRKAQDGYNLSIPQYSPESTQEFTWVGHDLGPSVLALLKNYSDPVWEQRVLGRSFPIVTARVTYPELARRISAALGKPVVFTPIATSGAKDIDLLHALQSEFGMYMDTPVPNPDFVALGVQFGTLEEFIASEIVPRFG